ncbi:FAU ubiquitin-like and ribosomal protein S30 [Penaeus chinensis]|uniref:FAU ubiquitin-like and ribosomal protein S30 n=1 Tax=Penaeus chinensis TaxID=139456 RepID=UPI001FB78559|nr:FAU ubiquitin-like and ribosomal protein S30 [Penaeus chinensis]
MIIYVRSKTTHVVENAEEHTVGDVRFCLCQAEELPLEEVRLYAAGALLDDDSFPLADLSVDTIEVNVALKGGKVHGSLSRAGKVKSQTPVVEKKEKKKAKTGRAKRRAQYERRFSLASVVRSDSKRGPNAQGVSKT